MRRTLSTLLSLGLLALVPAPPAAFASAGSDQIINECANESLSKTYTQKEYDQALADLPADLKEYTDCDGVIRTAKRAAAVAASGGGKGGGASPRAAGGGSGGSGPTTGAAGLTGPAGAASSTAASPAATDPGAGGTPAAPAAADPGIVDPAATDAANQAALEAAQKQGASAVQIGGTTLNPGDPAGVAMSLSDLPTPMLVLLGLFAAIALLGLAALVKSWILHIGRSRNA